MAKLKSPLVVGLVGFSVGSNHHPARVLHGSVYLGDGQASARVGIAFFTVPLSLPWRDTQGRWHEDGLPSCLGTSGQTNPITFGAVSFTRDGLRELGGLGRLLPLRRRLAPTPVKVRTTAARRVCSSSCLHLEPQIDDATGSVSMGVLLAGKPGLHRPVDVDVDARAA